jgi:hypothetical protein
MIRTIPIAMGGIAKSLADSRARAGLVSIPPMPGWLKKSPSPIAKEMRPMTISAVPGAGPAALSVIPAGSKFPQDKHLPRPDQDSAAARFPIFHSFIRETRLGRRKSPRRPLESRSRGTTDGQQLSRTGADTIGLRQERKPQNYEYVCRWIDSSVSGASLRDKSSVDKRLTILASHYCLNNHHNTHQTEYYSCGNPRERIPFVSHYFANAESRYIKLCIGRRILQSVKMDRSQLRLDYPSKWLTLIQNSARSNKA